MDLSTGYRTVNAKKGRKRHKMAREGYHRNEHTPGIWNILGELTDIFDLSDGCLYRHARAGRVIGIDYNHGAWHFSVRPGLEGPVSDIPQEYLMPPGELHGVYPQLISGLVSSRLYAGEIKSTRKKNLVKLYGALSGANCRPLVDYQTDIEKRRGK